MPAYRYQCVYCEKTHERLEPIIAPAAHDCPFCSSYMGMQRMNPPERIPNRKENL